MYSGTFSLPFFRLPADVKEKISWWEIRVSVVSRMKFRKKPAIFPCHLWQ